MTLITWSRRTSHCHQRGCGHHVHMTGQTNQCVVTTSILSPTITFPNTSAVTNEHSTHLPIPYCLLSVECVFRFSFWELSLVINVLSVLLQGIRLNSDAFDVIFIIPHQQYQSLLVDLTCLWLEACLSSRVMLISPPPSRCCCTILASLISWEVLILNDTCATLTAPAGLWLIVFFFNMSQRTLALYYM